MEENYDDQAEIYINNQYVGFRFHPCSCQTV